MKKVVVIILLVFCYSNYLSAQNAKLGSDISASYKVESSYRNFVYGTVGYGLALGNLSINYEYLFWKPDRKLLSNVRIKASAGYYAVWYITSQFYTVSFVGLVENNGNWDFEYGAGVSLFVQSYSKGIAPNVILGTRYQKPDGKLLFRCGIGFPEAVYGSLGFCF